MPGHADWAKVIAGRFVNTITVNKAKNRALRGEGSVTTGCLTVEANTDLQLFDSLISVLIGLICVVYLNLP
jgi:hypothetical protein